MQCNCNMLIRTALVVSSHISGGSVNGCRRAYQLRNFTSTTLPQLQPKRNGNGGFPSLLVNTDTATDRSLLVRSINTTGQNYAARKGTRARKEKKKVKKEFVKKTFMQRLMEKKANIAHTLQRPADDSHLPEPLDDVYFYERFQNKIWSFSEAVQNHREFHDPTIRNYPKSPLLIRIDIDMVYPNRPTKMMSTWKAIVEMESPFLLPGMTIPRIIAFCPDDTQAVTEVLNAGADIAGSGEIIKSIQEGNINIGEFEHVIAHPQMVNELTAIRGLLKRKFPTVNSKLVDPDLVSIVQRLKRGLKIEVQHTDREPDFAWIEVPIGKLDMSMDDLEANFIAILKDTLPRRVTGKPGNEFIVQCSLITSHSTEKFILDKEYYISKCDSQSVNKYSQEDEEESTPAADADADEDDKLEKSTASAP